MNPVGIFCCFAFLWRSPVGHTRHFRQGQVSASFNDAKRQAILMVVGVLTYFDGLQLNTNIIYIYIYVCG